MSAGGNAAGSALDGDVPAEGTLPAPNAELDLVAAHARRRSALFSVAAAAFLVALKLGTGLITGSIAFLAEAAHSATDLVAALLTLFAVRVALRPPDREHNYGHGKAEHLAALGESAFLLAIAAWIGEESIGRLVSGEYGHVEATWWAIAVLVVVASIDALRIVASKRGARRHDSAALAANAVHFTSDLAGTLAQVAHIGASLTSIAANLARIAANLPAVCAQFPALAPVDSPCGPFALGKRRRCYRASRQRDATVPLREIVLLGCAARGDFRPLPHRASCFRSYHRAHCCHPYGVAHHEALSRSRL